MKIIKAVIVPVGQKPYIEEIGNDLHSLQRIVGGYIETLHVTERLVIVCNEEAKLIGLEGNRCVGQDIIAGQFAVVADDGEGDFTSLTENEAEMILKRFDLIEQYTTKEVEDTLFIEILPWPDE